MQTEAYSPSNLLNRSKLPKDTFFNPDTPMYDANQPKAVSWRPEVWFDHYGLGRSLLLVVRPHDGLFYQRKGVAEPHAGRGGQGPAFRRYRRTTVLERKMTYSMGLSLTQNSQSTTDEFKRWQMADNKVLRFEMEFAHSDVSEWTSNGASSPTTI